MEVILKEAVMWRGGIRCRTYGADFRLLQVWLYPKKVPKEIERKNDVWELCGLISTNALELGIDIGKIDTANVLAGFPGTRASSAADGKSRKKRRACTNYLILDNLPFDQYISINRDWLFDGESESAVVDKTGFSLNLPISGKARGTAAYMTILLFF